MGIKVRKKAMMEMVKSWLKMCLAERIGKGGRKYS